MKRTTRSGLLATFASCGALLAPGVAQAHVSLHPNTIPAGAFVTLDVRVPGEEQGAYAYKLDMLVPPGFTEIDTQNVPGWSVKEVTSKLSKPIETDDGPVSEEVSQVIWSGDRTKLGRLDNATFMQFPLSVAIPGNLAGHSLAFKAVEYYSDGKVVHWIGSPSAEFPAPTINITPRGGVIEDVAGAEAGPAPGAQPLAATTPSAARSGKGSSNTLAIVALIVGALGLLAGIGGIAAARRSAGRAPAR
jgi:uncharacterized protein YcnI